MSIKNMLLILLVLVMSCNQEKNEKDYLTISGSITNVKEDSLKVFNFHGDEKVLHIKPDGTFKDTLKLKKRGMFFINYNKQQYRTFARNGYDMKLHFDADSIKNSINFSKTDNEELYYFKDKYYGLDYDYKSYNNMDTMAFKKQVEDYFVEYLEGMPQKDTAFFNYFNELMEISKNGILKSHKELTYYNSLKGKPSAIFTDYENYDGSKTSLADFKGSYVYIDIWATWCVPCIKEIPYLKELEEEYHNKNITFLSISVDQQKHKDKWKRMIKDKALSGVQLLSPSTVATNFMESYKVSSIPRFILLDPQGNIINAIASSPSEKENIRRLLNNHLNK